ncbi:DUF1749 domain-containing protein [Enterovibrio sp. ZSDZ35]|uniref:DUF1749 domain-containing protein n=1 Tax=Enterovibrio qingdaonensis TaxID=2899818 RepID=A0ABT5QIS9_9GAMM|nr:DUF1749 domain-containing protein [Enterovibrio sp. ZSDZ35]MDD1780375.1 DUF1749 domain-containing protein [Enterovibrio sp. ZSDZ35]
MEDFRISISRLIVVDSVGVAIAEIDLRNGGIIIAKGNVGKTSILNAIRLFLLPETNFKKSFQKFGFMNNKGEPYTDDESFEHYFPSRSSFLILECENFLGGPAPHCQILYRGESKSYKRMFTSLPYQNIKDLFWDSSIGEDGIGGAVQNLSIDYVKKALKERDPKYFKTIERPQAIKEALYANDLLDVNAMRYCLFPLSKLDDASINSFKALVKLLFDMKTGSDAVRLAIANIIESSKKERKDELSLDINEFLNRNQMLGDKELHLQKVKNLKPKFEELSIAYATLKENQSAETKMLQFAHLLRNDLESKAKESKLFAERVHLALEHNNSRKKLRDDAQQHLHELNGVLKKESAKLEKLQPQLDTAKRVIDDYFGKPISEIEEILSDELDKETANLENLKDAAARRMRIDELQTSILVETKCVTALRQSLELKEFFLSKQLEVGDYQVLASINKAISKANPGRRLAATELECIRGFLALFERDNQQYRFFDRTLNIASLVEEHSTEEELEQRTQSLSALKDELQSLEKISNQSEILTQAEITKLQRKLNRYDSELSIVKSYEFNLKTANDTSEEIQALTIQVEEAEQSLAIAQRSLDMSQRELADSKESLSSFNSNLEKLKALNVRVKNSLVRHKLADLPLEKLSGERVKVSEQSFENLESALLEKVQARSGVVSAIHFLVNEGVIDNDDDLFTATLSEEQIRHTFRQIESKFVHVNDEIANLKRQFIALKSEIHGIITELEKNRQLIDSFEGFINREFQKVTINDLSEVKAKIGVNSRFEALLAEVAHIDLYADSRLSSEFVDRLKTFSKEFFDEGVVSTLTMEKILTGINYHVKKQGAKSLETKSQSTSTVMLINIKLVEVLLKSVQQSSCKVFFPLIIDEGASVDLSQFQWLLPQLNESGFRVLSASTHSVSSELILLFGYYFKIDSIKTSLPYHPERQIAFTSEPEYIIKPSVAKEDQMCIFGETDE